MNPSRETTAPMIVLPMILRFVLSTEAVQAPARVNVTCVTPLGEEMLSIS